VFATHRLLGTIMREISHAHQCHIAEIPTRTYVESQNTAETISPLATQEKEVGRWNDDDGAIQD
jgi:hypothetical protein